MNNKVKIDDIVSGMDFQFDEYSTLLHIKNGEVVSIYNDYLRKAEDGEYDELEDLDDEEKLALDIVDYWENYERLPTTFDINEYQMMEDFCFTVRNEKKQDKLLRAISGRGAFRRFKDTAHDLDLIEDWYSYRDECYKQIAIKFCEGLGLDYVE